MSAYTLTTPFIEARQSMKRRSAEAAPLLVEVVLSGGIRVADVVLSALPESTGAVVDVVLVVLSGAVQIIDVTNTAHECNPQAIPSAPFAD